MSLIIPRVFSKAYFVMFTVFTCSFARNPSNLCSEGASEDPLGSRGVWSPLDSFLRHSRSILRHNHGAWQPTFHHTTHTETLLNKAKQHWNSTRIQKKRNFDSTGAVFWRKLQQREVCADHATANFADANVTLAREGSALYRNWLRFKFDRQIN